MCISSFIHARACVKLH
uniref:Uncharacterized protein n=1 Tax=Arundo donax TaxID=35708 RepID=A0A0A9A546_ARUDO